MRRQNSRLRHLRKKALLTLEELSGRSGLSVRTIERYELGQSTAFSIRPSTVKKLAKGLGVSRRQLMEALGYSLEVPP